MAQVVVLGPEIFHGWNAIKLTVSRLSCLIKFPAHLLGLGLHIKQLLVAHSQRLSAERFNPESLVCPRGHATVLSHGICLCGCIRTHLAHKIKLELSSTSFVRLLRVVPRPVLLNIGVLYRLLVLIDEILHITGVCLGLVGSMERLLRLTSELQM